MTLLLGSIGWGLFAVGALSHSTHLGRLETLLRSHTRHSRLASRLLVGAEAMLALAFPIAVLALPDALPVIASIGFALALGFTAWVLRLKLTGSALPCACSFASTPTTWSSVARAAATLSVVAAAFAVPDVVTDDVATLLTGAAAAVALYLLPDALAWPAFSTSMKRYADAHPSPTMVPLSVKER